jgi:protein-S-isoprenylcysteine O-methyltransferase Ste14
MAEARQLASSRAYRIIRYPCYLAEEVATIGGVIQFSFGNGMVLLGQIACQIRRMSNEETVLMDVFPEYTRYMRTTARIIPGLY